MGLENLVFKNFILENLKDLNIARVKPHQYSGVVYYVTFNPLISKDLDDTEYLIKGNLPPKQTVLDVTELNELEKYPLIGFVKKMMTDIKLGYNIPYVFLENPARKGNECCFGNIRFVYSGKALYNKQERIFILFAPIDELTNTLAENGILKT